ncbi:MAG: thiosulfate oxidation carrier protein SoxY [Burkholderiaceae bacterium]
MNQRRAFIQRSSGLTVLGLALAAGLFKPGNALAATEWNKALFDTKTVADTEKLLGTGTPVESKDITLTGPDIAENGAVVPISVSTTIPKVEQIVILVEKNPNTVAAAFGIPEGTDASVTTRVKLGQSTDVYALVKADGKLYFTKKEVKVTLGGCGG